MCQLKQIDVPAPRTPTSPWRRFLRQPQRPKLSRSVTSGARINLNRYWNKFEEVTSLNRVPHARFFAAPTLSVTGRLAGNAIDDNAINDNLINERTEIIGNFKI